MQKELSVGYYDSTLKIQKALFKAIREKKLEGIVRATTVSISVAETPTGNYTYATFRSLDTASTSLDG